MKQNPLTQSKKIREEYLRVRGFAFTKETSTGGYKHPTIVPDQAVMSWLEYNGWIQKCVNSPMFKAYYIVL